MCNLGCSRTAGCSKCPWEEHTWQNHIGAHQTRKEDVRIFHKCEPEKHFEWLRCETKAASRTNANSPCIHAQSAADVRRQTIPAVQRKRSRWGKDTRKPEKYF